MVLYSCPTCYKQFNRKSSFVNHTEHKKTPCSTSHKSAENTPKSTKNHRKYTENTPEISENSLKIPENTPEIYENLSTNPENSLTNPENLLNFKNEHKCDYCYQTFSRHDTLKRHVKNRCKIKKEDDDNKENIFKLLLEKEELLKLERAEKEKLNNRVDDLQKQLIELTKTIKDLSNKTINNINKGVINNNITITTEQLSRFGKEDLNKISQQEFLKIRSCQGIGIFKECAKLIYNNKTFNKTVYVADFSRRKAMIWDGKNWILSDLEEVVNIMKEKIRDFYNLKLGNLEDEKIMGDFETRIQKYFDMLYDEYDEEKEDDKKFMERAKGLQDKFEKDLIKWLFNIKKDVIDNYNNILQSMCLDKTLLEQNKLIDL